MNAGIQGGPFMGVDIDRVWADESKEDYEEGRWVFGIDFFTGQDATELIVEAEGDLSNPVYRELVIAGLRAAADSIAKIGVVTADTTDEQRP